MRKLLVIIAMLSTSITAHAAQEVCFINDSAQAWDLNINNGQHTFAPHAGGGQAQCISVDDNTGIWVQFIVALSTGQRYVTQQAYVNYSTFNGWGDGPNDSWQFLNGGICVGVPQGGATCAKPAWGQDHVMRVFMHN